MGNILIQFNISLIHSEAFSVSLARLRLWPATPKQPKTAFAFDLLDWMEALLLECQVSVNDFCNALKAKLPKYAIVSFYHYRS
jgi:hypothetical protein